MYFVAVDSKDNVEEFSGEKGSGGGGESGGESNVIKPKGGKFVKVKNMKQFEPKFYTDEDMEDKVLGHILPSECKKYLTFNFELDNKMKQSIMAPFINGTACVGKTTFIRNVDRFPLKPKIYGAGAFRGKDLSIIKANAYTCSYYNLAINNSNKDVIIDRCPLNNLIWRIIMALLDEKIRNEFTLAKALNSIPRKFYESMRNFPIIYVINSNVDEVYKKMRLRASGGDLFRADIEGYVECQNIVYSAFADICGFPLYDVGKPGMREKLLSDFNETYPLLGNKYVQDSPVKKYKFPYFDSTTRMKAAKRLKIIK